MRTKLLARLCGFPPLHADFELGQKLACGSDIFPRIPHNLYSFRLRHMGDVK